MSSGFSSNSEQLACILPVSKGEKACLPTHTLTGMDTAGRGMQIKYGQNQEIFLIPPSQGFASTAFIVPPFISLYDLAGGRQCVGADQDGVVAYLNGLDNGGVSLECQKAEIPSFPF